MTERTDLTEGSQLSEGTDLTEGTELSEVHCVDRTLTTTANPHRLTGSEGF